MIEIPLRTGRGLNSREHHFTRARRVKKEREAVAWALAGQRKPPLPCVVTLTRVSPGNGMDDDGLVGSVKACRDQIAEWLGVDDKHRHIVRYRYAQIKSAKGVWGVRIEFGPMVASTEAEAVEVA